jgi:hypothetical protein
MPDLQQSTIAELVVGVRASGYRLQALGFGL